MAAHWHKPQPVELLQPSPAAAVGIAAIVLVPFVGLLIGIVIWRAFNKVSSRRRDVR